MFANISKIYNLNNCFLKFKFEIIFFLKNLGWRRFSFREVDFTRSRGLGAGGDFPFLVDFGRRGDFTRNERGSRFSFSTVDFPFGKENAGGVKTTEVVMHSQM